VVVVVVLVVVVVDGADPTGLPVAFCGAPDTAGWALVGAVTGGVVVVVLVVDVVLVVLGRVASPRPLGSAADVEDE
jgi:hypothetical protein